MPIGILNNIASLAAENQLTVTNNNLQNTLSQLSSGDRINSGADDPAGLAIANGLQANVTALTQSAQNVSDGTGELQVADGALSQVTTLLNRAVTLATESSTGTVSDSQRVALQSEFSQITQEIDQIGQNTTFNGAPIFSGGSTNYNQLTTAVTNPAGMASAVTGNMEVEYWDSSLATPAYVTQTFDATTNDGTSGTVAGMIENINNSGTGLVATLNSSGNIVVTDTYNRGNSTDPLADAGSTMEVNGDTAADTMANTTNSNTTDIYLSDSTVAGSESIGVTLGAFSSDNMNGISLANDNLSTATAAQSALTDINNAISQVAALRGQIGAVTERLQSAGNVISSQTQNLTSAEDNIMEADIPTAVANLTNYSILEQTGISALAQANQQQQLVLKLLQ
ncbi:MAG TPA: flagellin [Verrucomicrobiae bacterium]|jgi:flagellin|nr:flagellin [Verrucomicrobiae bacterium]